MSITDRFLKFFEKHFFTFIDQNVNQKLFLSTLAYIKLANSEVGATQNVIKLSNALVEMR